MLGVTHKRARILGMTLWSREEHNKENSLNWEEVLDPEYGLQQDDWSLSKPTFGEGGHLEVIGWSGKTKGRIKYYILECSVCKKDSELFAMHVCSFIRTSKSTKRMEA